MLVVVGIVLLTQLLLCSILIFVFIRSTTILLFVLVFGVDVWQIYSVAPLVRLWSVATSLLGLAQAVCFVSAAVIIVVFSICAFCVFV